MDGRGDHHRLYTPNCLDMSLVELDGGGYQIVYATYYKDERWGTASAITEN